MERVQESIKEKIKTVNKRWSRFQIQVAHQLQLKDHPQPTSIILSGLLELEEIHYYQRSSWGTGNFR